MSEKEMTPGNRAFKGLFIRRKIETGHLNELHKILNFRKIRY
jgi:hypothetical protein